MAAKKNAFDGKGFRLDQVDPQLHTPQEIQVANHSRKLAFDYINKSSFGRALAHLFVALRLVPEWRNDLKNVFWEALSGGCQQLADAGRLEETIQLRKDALLFYPKDDMILMDIGSIYFKLDKIEQALEYYQQVLQINPSLLPASRAIQSIHNKLVERWHFRMLNDTGRNEAYHHAIAYRIQQGHSSVLDVGAGSGILSLFAAEEGADHVWACESNTFMIKTAKSVLAANNASERIHLISKHSSSILVERDIPKKVSMIVTEVFDAALLGEGILSMLIHAWDNLLLPPTNKLKQHELSHTETGIVVPFSATVWVAAIQCIHVARRHRLLPHVCSCHKTEKAVSHNNNLSFIVHGKSFELCKFCEGPSEEFRLDQEEILFNLRDASIAFDVSEPYTTENLEKVPFGFEFLSKPHKVLDINFNNLEELQACSRRKEEMVTVHINAEGSMDALASWFHLNLDNNGTVVSTAPFSEDGFYRGLSWHQAIYPSLIPKKVSCGHTVSLSIDTREGALKIFEKEDACPELHLISENVVAFLNNKTWMKALNTAAADYIKSVSSTCTRTKIILDLNPFPVFGLRVLKGCNSPWKLIAWAETRRDEEYIIAVAEQNLIDPTQIQFVTDGTLEKKVENELFDVICINFVDSSGEFKENVTQILPFLLNKISQSGTIVPHSLSIECQLIESKQLILESRVVSDESVGNFQIAEFMNKYAVDYHLDVPYHGLQFKALSNHVEIFKFLINSSNIDSILGEQSRDHLVQTTENGAATGVIYWIKLLLRPGMLPITTLCPDSHCNQVVLFSSLDVQVNNTVKLKCQFSCGLLDVKLTDCC